MRVIAESKLIIRSIFLIRIISPRHEEEFQFGCQIITSIRESRPGPNYGSPSCNWFRPNTMDALGPSVSFRESSKSLNVRCLKKWRPHLYPERFARGSRKSPSFKSYPIKLSIIDGLCLLRTTLFKSIK